MAKRKQGTQEIKEWQKIVRCILHVPAGAINGLLFTLGAHIGWAFLFVFMVYELNEDKHLKDHAYLDLFGWFWGFIGFWVYFVLHQDLVEHYIS